MSSISFFSRKLLILFKMDLSLLEVSSDTTWAVHCLLLIIIWTLERDLNLKITVRRAIVKKVVRF